MANQHTKKGSTPIYRKCASPECTEQIRATPCMIEKGAGVYCSRRCANACKTATKYTQEVIDWIVKNASTVSRKDMATKLNSNAGAFRRFVSGLRSKGYKIPKELPRPVAPAGTIVERKRENGTIRKYEKLENGKWKEIPKDRPKGRPKTNDNGAKNNYQKRTGSQPKTMRPPRRTSITISKDYDTAMEKSKLFVSPAVIKEKEDARERTKIILPGGTFAICDSDKVDATVRYLLRKVS